jgi:UV DNA damage endonuclease
MKIGYPCINRTIGCTANHTFRLASYSEENLVSTVQKNLKCLREILDFNAANGLLFFRISSDIVPFASHPVCRFDWKRRFGQDFREIGALIKNHAMRVSMHPDQFVIINAKKEEIFERSVLELEYHRSVLDSMGLGKDAKIQIHVGGLYGDREASIARFIEKYRTLSDGLKKRMVIENDDRLFSLEDCLEISSACGVPVLFDSFHHECLNNGVSLREAALAAAATWKNSDGCIMMDYSEQQKGKRPGTHAESINLKKFNGFLRQIKGIEADIMLEIKDKEKSALKARGLIKNGKSCGSSAC